MTNDRFSRRAILKSLGASAAMLPLLSTSRVKAASATGAPKRLVTVTWTNGVIREEFFPQGDQLEFRAVTKPLEALRSKVLLPCGLDDTVYLEKGALPGGHFTYASLLTGTTRDAGTKCGGVAEQEAEGPSVDQVIASALGQRVSLPAMLLNLAVHAAPARIGTTWRAGGQPNAAERNPYHLFDTLFASSTLPAGQIDGLRARRKSVLDFVGKELNRFGTRLGNEDRAKIGAHLESIRELERQLAPPANPRACEAPMVGAKLDLSKPENYVAHTKLQLDLIATALRCDLTRVVTLELTNAGENSFAPDFQGPGARQTYHYIAHNASLPDVYQRKLNIDRWYFEQVAYLARKLNDVPEAGGTVLDNSAIVTFNGMADGAAHVSYGLPITIVGSCGGYFRTGRAVRFGRWIGGSGAYYKARSGVSHSRLLATLCHAMDVPVDSFGDPQHGAGTALSELT